MATELYAGRPALFTMTFWELAADGVTKVATNPDAATLEIQVGYTADPVVVALADFTLVKTGTYTYLWDTTSKATAVTGPVEVTTQLQSTGALNSMSDPASFTVLPPRVGGLT